MTNPLKIRKDKWGRLERRHLRIRKKVEGTPERPRILVRKSLKHLYVMAIDDTPGTGSTTLLALSTRQGKGDGKGHCNVTSAAELGKKFGAALLEKGLKRACFDRGGYRYHGCVKALCDGLREAGVEV